MLKNTKNSSKKGLFTKKYAVVLVLLFVVSLLIGLELMGSINVFGKNSGGVEITSRDDVTKTVSVDYGPPKPEDSVISPEKSSATETKEQLASQSSELSVLITRASRDSVGVFIEKIDSGICKLSVTQSGIEKISMTAEIIQERDYSTCRGFDLDSTKLDNAPLTVNVSVTSGSRIGAVSQEVR